MNCIKSQSSPRILFAIDLGTTFSSVARWDAGSTQKAIVLQAIDSATTQKAIVNTKL